jgi:para-nitrobenzyl esterase
MRPIAEREIDAEGVKHLRGRTGFRQCPGRSGRFASHIDVQRVLHLASTGTGMTPMQNSTLERTLMAQGILRGKIDIGLILLFAAFLPASSFAQLKDPVPTDKGLVSGAPGRDVAITTFKGIPYAAPPIGSLRWAAPQSPQSWRGILKADHFSDGCEQDFPKGDFPKSEDCLYLNVWTPAQSADARLPVMFWIHGGGLRVGSAREALYDGEEIAKKGVVVVTLNYRLGVFGFLAYPELTKESPHQASGNYGLLDQSAALQWVHRNIANFGGDPDKVTIFGQSGGAFSVNAQVASPLSKGLFRGAISESGGLGIGFAGTAMPSLKDGENSGVKIAESVGAQSLAELRTVPAEKLLQAGGSAGPVVDGWFFPESMTSLFEHGKQNEVQMIVGSNSDEAQHFIRSALSAKDFVAQAQKECGNDVGKFLALYPSISDPYAKVSQQLQIADHTALGERRLADYVSRGGKKAFVYFFAYQDVGGYNSETPTLGLRLGADHGAELPYVFGLLNHWKTSVPPNDLALQNTIMTYWTNFAKTLDPNGDGLPVWKPFSESDSDVMVLDQIVGMEPHPRAGQISFWQAHTGK